MKPRLDKFKSTETTHAKRNFKSHFHGATKFNPGVKKNSAFVQNATHPVQTSDKNSSVHLNILKPALEIFKLIKTILVKVTSNHLPQDDQIQYRFFWMVFYLQR